MTTVPCWARVRGPLAPYAEGFRVELERLGYTPLTAAAHVRLMAHLSRWLAREGVDGVGVDARRWWTPTSPNAARPVMSGTSPAGRCGRCWATCSGWGWFRLPRRRCRRARWDGCCASYRDYLSHRARTGRGDGRAERADGAPVPAGPTQADGMDVWIWNADRGRGDRVRGGAEPAAAQVGQADGDRAAVPARFLARGGHHRRVTGRRRCPRWPGGRRPVCPRRWTVDQVAALLACCDERTATGRRDLAILTVLVRLGLRAGEVAALRLDDIDWRRGEITVRGKGNRRRSAAAAGRCRGTDRRLPARRAPRGRAGPGGVRPRAGPLPGVDLQRRDHGGESARADGPGLGLIGAHRLRHSAATAMLRSGGSLTEIGQTLRHVRPLTTAIYAKVDLDALRRLARPWPGEPA